MTDRFSNIYTNEIAFAYFMWAFNNEFSFLPLETRYPNISDCGNASCSMFLQK
jgi:hypothetical protein